MLPPIFDNDAVRIEFERWSAYFGDEDPYSGPSTVGLHEVLRAHFFVVDYFYSKGQGIGGIGPKDPDMLHSAIYRQFVSFGGKDKWSTHYERAATLLFGLISDHPFHDGNKRTGLLTLLLFLVKIGRTPTVPQKDLEDFAVEIAEGNLAKYARYKQYSKRQRDPEVLFIADYLKRNSRELDKRYYTITYRELDRRLRDFGYRLDNPRGNHIDVVRVETRRKRFGFGPREAVNVKVAQIGFPGWKSQVGKGAISTVRREARLMPEHGFDSQSFYQGVDPIHSLIAEYAGPLERLAYR
ncbi:MAG: type II toxin-antitoxin system death-on-curing family toxin [Pseudomonadales bacterium]